MRVGHVARARRGRRLPSRERHAAQRPGRARRAAGEVPGARAVVGRLGALAAALGLALGVITDRLGSQQLNPAVAAAVVGARPADGRLCRAPGPGAAGPPPRRGAAMAPDAMTTGTRAAGALRRSRRTGWRLSLPLQAARVALLWHVGDDRPQPGPDRRSLPARAGMEILMAGRAPTIDAAQVQRLADVPLAPAALFTGLAVPDDGPAAPRRTAGARRAGDHSGSTRWPPRWHW